MKATEKTILAFSVALHRWTRRNVCDVAPRTAPLSSFFRSGWAPTWTCRREGRDSGFSCRGARTGCCTCYPGASIKWPGPKIRNTNIIDIFCIRTSGSLSAVSTPIFARKYEILVFIFSIFRDLHDVHSFSPLQSQQFSNFSSKILLTF